MLRSACASLVTLIVTYVPWISLGPVSWIKW